MPQKTSTTFAAVKVLEQLHHIKASGQKGLAILLDPDKLGSSDGFDRLLASIEHSPADFIFVGGSLLVEDAFDEAVRAIKARASKPIVLFPGDVNQIHPQADALLLLSVISGRNADLLIGKHVTAAPRIKAMGLETISTGYMLVESGALTTALYVSQTMPIPRSKPEIAAATALAGEMLGMQAMYLDAGSGAQKPVPPQMIQAVRNEVDLPMIVGGGIRSEIQAEAAWMAGADIVVMGTAFEQNPELIASISSKVLAGL